MIHAFTPELQIVTAHRPALISHPAEARKLSWPGWLITYQDGIPSKGHPHPSHY